MTDARGQIVLSQRQDSEGLNRLCPSLQTANKQKITEKARAGMVAGLLIVHRNKL